MKAHTHGMFEVDCIRHMYLLLAVTALSITGTMVHAQQPYWGTFQGSNGHGYDELAQPFGHSAFEIPSGVATAPGGSVLVNELINYVLTDINSHPGFGLYQCGGSPWGNTNIPFSIKVCGNGVINGGWAWISINPSSSTVSPISVSISTSATTVYSGNPVTFTATASGGTSMYTYQWLSGTSPVCSSDTTAAGTSNPQTEYPASNTFYCVMVSDGSSAIAESSTIGIFVIAPPAPLTVSASSSATTVASGNPVTLTASASGGTSPYSYQWLSGTSATCSADTTPAGSSNPVTEYPTSNTFYCVSVSDSASATALSPTVGITVMTPAPGAPLTVSVSPAQQSINPGQQVTITATPSGGVSPYTYNWFSGTSPSCPADASGTPISMSNPITESPTSNTFYCVSVSDSAVNSIFSTTSDISITAAPVTTTIPASSGGGCGGCGGGSSPPPHMMQPILAAVQQNSSCSTAINMTPSMSRVLAVNGTNFTVYDYYTFRGYADYLINGSVHVLVPGKTYYFINNTKYAYSLGIGINSIMPANYITPVFVSRVSICYIDKAKIQAQRPPPVFVPVNLTLNVDTHDFLVNTSSSKSNDTVDIFIDGRAVASGTGFASYNAFWYPAGTHIITGKDIDSGTFINRTMTKQLFTPGLRFTKVCADNATLAYNCTTNVIIMSHNGMLLGTLYVNGKPVGTTNSTFNYTISARGLYNITFSTAGDDVYASNSISYTFQNGPTYDYMPSALAIVAAMCAATLLIVARRNRTSAEEQEAAYN